jgi:molybdopterin molybdotransferase/putative molybdopterin biosynthesis protein
MTNSVTAEALRRARIRCGISQSELARRAGISRQALGALESGAYQPSVAVALALARELGESVERLFGGEADVEDVSAVWTGGGEAGRKAAAPARVALGRVGARLVAVPQAVVGLRLAAASGIVERESRGRAEVAAFRSREEIESTLLVAGCDPAITVLADWLTRRRSPASIAAVPCASRKALAALNEGRVHVAGVHLRDPRSGEYNLAPARVALGRRRALVVNFACWEMGLAIAPGNRLSIRGCDDLARSGLRIVNREPGSGARAALDEALAALGLDGGQVAGYERELGGHLEVAAAIAAGDADTGVTIRVAAQAYGLGFIPVRGERYDLIVPQREMESAPIRAMLDALNSSRFAGELAGLCGYDTNRTGNVIARLG